MLRTGRKAQPATGRIASGFIGKLAFEHKELRTFLIADGTRVCAGRPTFKPHYVRETVLLVERPRNDRWDRGRLPGERLRVDDDVTSFLAGKLS